MIGKRRLNFSDAQLHQFERNNQSLRKLNQEAIGSLPRIGYTALSDAAYRKVGESLAVIAIRMTSGLRVCREILAAAQAEELRTDRTEEVHAGPQQRVPSIDG